MKKIMIAAAMTLSLSQAFANESGDAANVMKNDPSNLAVQLGTVSIGDGYTQDVVCAIHTNEGSSVLSQADCAPVGGKLLKALQELSKKAAANGMGYTPGDAGQIGGN